MVQPVRPQDASGVYRRQLTGLGATSVAEATTRAGAATRSRRADSVALSEQARLLARSLQAADALPEVREQLVAELRARVQAGTYDMRAESIAASMLGGTDTQA